MLIAVYEDDDGLAYYTSDGGAHNSKSRHQNTTRKTRDGAEKSFLTDCLATANWLAKSLDQRAQTILSPELTERFTRCRRHLERLTQGTEVGGGAGRPTEPRCT